jgi:long-chain acyl-CoA synthetase
MVAVLSAAAGEISQEELEQSVRETVAMVNDSVEKHARIGAVILSREHWTIENEILTPTLKIRREKVEGVFGETAQELARQAAESGQLLVHWFN